MSLGPVFHVEMLTVSRRRRYFFTRVFYGLILLTIMSICYGESFRVWRGTDLNQQAAFAASFFMAFSWVQLIGVLFMTPAMVAGTIAGEHERKTIDYLLTTTLTDIEITLGKFAARLLAIGMQLAAGVPILAIAMTLGGIAPEMLFKSFFIAVASLISVGGLCLFLSSRARTSREAIVRSYVVLTALMLVPPIVWAFAELFNGRSGLTFLRVLTELNPLAYLGLAIFAEQAAGVAFSYFMAFHLSSGVLLAGLAVYNLRRFYVQQMGLAPLKPKVKSKTSGEKRGPRWSLFPEYSMLWKEVVAGRGAIRLGWIGKLAALALYALALWGLGAVVYEQFDYNPYGSYSDTGDKQAPHVFGGVAVPMIASLAMLLIAGRAAGSITSEREQDTWLTLISTPLTDREIVWAKFCAAIYSVRYWYLLVVLGWLLCIVITPEFWWAVPILVVVHLVMLSLAASIGVFCSLASKTSLRAMGAALTVLVVVLSIGPAFLAAISEAEFFVGFSLPMTMGAAHFMSWASTRGSIGRFEADMAGGVFVATIVYAIASVGIYASCIVNFDALTGRIVTPIGEPRRRPSDPVAGPTNGSQSNDAPSVDAPTGEAQQGA